MEILGQKLLSDFGRLHADALSQINAWQAEVLETEWDCPQDIKLRYPHASFLADNRVVFNLKGNKYRIDTKIAYRNKTVFVKRIGTHEEYNRWKF